MLLLIEKPYGAAMLGGCGSLCAHEKNHQTCNASGAGSGRLDVGDGSRQNLGNVLTQRLDPGVVERGGPGFAE